MCMQGNWKALSPPPMLISLIHLCVLQLQSWLLYTFQNTAVNKIWNLETSIWDFALQNLIATVSNPGCSNHSSDIMAKRKKAMNKVLFIRGNWRGRNLWSQWVFISMQPKKAICSVWNPNVYNSILFMVVCFIFKS